MALAIIVPDPPPQLFRSVHIFSRVASDRVAGDSVRFSNEADLNIRNISPASGVKIR